MTTYVIGDVQGCYDPLCRLLDKIDFNERQDTVWFTGDLVNRGPDSLGVLRFVYTHRQAMRTVLGNHEMALLAVANGMIPFQEKAHTFSDVLSDVHREEYLDWLRHCPFAHYQRDQNWLLIHAGLVPNWDLRLTLALAQEAQAILQSEQPSILLQHLYDNTPDCWHPDLRGWPRFCFIVNVFTRIRFCTAEGVLDLTTKTQKHAQLHHYFPWFEVFPFEKTGFKILFGHWAALEGKTHCSQAIALDTGCVWGKKLTAYAIETGNRYCLDCPAG